MPTRDKFPKQYFDGNPYDGEEPEGAYKRLRWGNEPQETFEIDAPEPMIGLGVVAQLITEEGVIAFEEEDAPFLAVGLETNRVYVIPRDEEGNPVNVPEDDYEDAGEIYQTDYLSDKGETDGSDAYYYHEHENPYPRLMVHETGVMVLEPNELEDGSRSYAVGDEGIIG